MSPARELRSPYTAPGDALAVTSGTVSADNATVRTSVVANRSIVIESVLHGDKGRHVVRFEQQLDYTNRQKYTDEGWVQVSERDPRRTSRLGFRVVGL